MEIQTLCVHYLVHQANAHWTGASRLHTKACTIISWEVICNIAAMNVDTFSFAGSETRLAAEQVPPDRKWFSRASKHSVFLIEFLNHLLCRWLHKIQKKKNKVTSIITVLKYIKYNYETTWCVRISIGCHSTRGRQVCSAAEPVESWRNLYHKEPDQTWQNWAKISHSTAFRHSSPLLQKRKNITLPRSSQKALKCSRRAVVCVCQRGSM